MGGNIGILVGVQGVPGCTVSREYLRQYGLLIRKLFVTRRSRCLYLVYRRAFVPVSTVHDVSCDDGASWARDAARLGRDYEASPAGRDLARCSQLSIEDTDDFSDRQHAWTVGFDAFLCARPSSFVIAALFDKCCSRPFSSSV